MLPNALFSTQVLGVLAQTHERFQLIAKKLEARCVWLSDPEAGLGTEAINTVIIDSDLLQPEADHTEERPSSAREHKPQAGASQNCHCSLSSQGGVTVAQQCAQLSYFKECGRHLLSSHPQQARKLVIYQCSD